MTKLDPIVSLSVALAEAPGSCACLFGSGVSVDAGVPTGWAIYRDCLRRLYRLEMNADDTPDDATLDEWLATTNRADLGYSSLLDLIAPDPAVRRELLAAYFQNAAPGRAHELLADLAVRGFIRVFVTTSFDRLLEGALEARGVAPVVVSDDASLAAMPRREHSPIFIVKAHGDYLQETIRNTPSELAALEPDLTAELQVIADHYGLLVLGWSGSDPALATVLRNRKPSRYGVWWLSLVDPPVEPGRSLAEAVDARVIVRRGAGELLDDLWRRLGVYVSHPSGGDPGTVHDEVLGLVRTADAIGLDETQRHERYVFESSVELVIADHFTHHLDEATVRDAWGRLGGTTDRRLASLIPLALHRPGDFGAELRAHADWATGVQPRGGSTTWLQAWTLPFWSLGFSLGGLLIRLGRYEPMHPLLTVTWTNMFNLEQPFIGAPGAYSDRVAELFGPAPAAGRTWLLPAWSWLGSDIAAKEWLRDRYPDWLRRDGEPHRSLTEFAVLVSIAAGVHNDSGRLAIWSLRPDVAKSYARRLNRDAGLRADAAHAVGLSLADFDAQAPGLLRSAHGLGMFPEVNETANTLETGSPH